MPKMKVELGSCKKL